MPFHKILAVYIMKRIRIQLEKIISVPPYHDLILNKVLTASGYIKYEYILHSDQQVVTEVSSYA